MDARARMVEMDRLYECIVYRRLCLAYSTIQIRLEGKKGEFKCKVVWPIATYAT